MKLNYLVAFSNGNIHHILRINDKIYYSASRPDVRKHFVDFARDNFPYRFTLHPDNYWVISELNQEQAVVMLESYKALYDSP